MVSVGRDKRAKRVLVVEDEGELLGILSAGLISSGYEVVQASNGSAARQLLDQRPSQFDIVISDLRMPETNGLELLEYSKATYPATKFIVITAHVDESKDLLFAMGVDDFMLKPFDGEEFIRLVKQVDERSTSRRPSIQL